MRKLKTLSFVPLVSFDKSGAKNYFDILYKHFEVFYPDDSLPSDRSKYHKFGSKKELIYVPKSFELIQKIEEVTLLKYNTFYIYLDKKGNIIGGVSYTLIKATPVINAVYLDFKYRGKGLGIKLYKLLLDEYGKFVSDTALTMDSFLVYKHFYEKNKCKGVYVDKNKIEETKIIELTFEKQIYEYKKDYWVIEKGKITKNSQNVAYAFAEHFRLMIIK